MQVIVHSVAAVVQHCASIEKANLSSHTVLLNQGLLSEVDLQGIIRAQADIHAPGKEGGERVAVVVQKQAVVGQRAHAQPDLQVAVTVVLPSSRRLVSLHMSRQPLFTLQ